MYWTYNVGPTYGWLQLIWDPQPSPVVLISNNLVTSERVAQKNWCFSKLADTIHVMNVLLNFLPSTAFQKVPMFVDN